MDHVKFMEESEQRIRDDAYDASVYLAGPIDHWDGDPDARHEELARLVKPNTLILCPFCAQRYYQSAPAQMFTRNLAGASGTSHVIAVWRGPVGQPSFGTPIELVTGAADRPEQTVVVGTMGSGMTAQALRARGVREVETLKEAVALLRI